MEAVVQALAAEVVGVWPGSEPLQTQNHIDEERDMHITVDLVT